MLKNELKFYIPFAKIDKEQRMVYGYASTEAEDSQGEIVELQAIKEAWDDYWKWANIREMHQLSAVGVGKEYQFDDKGVWIGAKIVDDMAWKKVKEGVYKGFSIGGKTLEKKGNRIKKLRLDEISIVDRPANPEAVFTIIKRDNRDWQQAKSEILKVDSLLKIIKQYKEKMEEELKKFRRTKISGGRIDLKKQESPAQSDAPEEERAKTEPTEQENVSSQEQPTEQKGYGFRGDEENNEEENGEEENGDEENGDEEDWDEEDWDEELEKEAIKEFVGNLSLLIKILEKKKVNSKKVEALKQALNLIETAMRQEEEKPEEKPEEEKPEEENQEEEKVMKLIKTELSGITQKVVDSLAKVERDLSSLKERVEKLEKQPSKNRPVASYLVEKGEKIEEAKSVQDLRKELGEIEAEIEKVHTEALALISNPDPAKQARLEKRLRELEQKYTQKKVELRKAVYGI
jgi:hypothetical protein